LIDRQFLDQLRPEDEDLLPRLADLLDASESAIYEPVKETLRAMKDHLLQQNVFQRSLDF
jgi:hypothetical protein